ncbi:hypothetical protein SVIOM342S_03592 [Streptomyces violaceorubidus]
MDAAQQEATARARELQRNWYGEPLGALFRRLIDDLGLNQARLAGVLGLSAPMLSQLMSGQRAKIGNPAVVQRVQLLQDLAGQVADGSVSAAEATERMDEIKKSQGSVLSNRRSRAHHSTCRFPPGPSRPPRRSAPTSPPPRTPPGTRGPHLPPSTVGHGGAAVPVRRPGWPCRCCCSRWPATPSVSGR